MALLLQTPGRGGRRGKRPLQSEINVTPFVDVMLVLLIVFMITAPMLATGVDVALPKTSTQTLPSTMNEPLSVTLRADGRLFIQEDEIERDALVARLQAIVSSGYDERIYVRGDEAVAYGDVMQVLGRIQGAGFANVALVTDPEGERE